MNVRRAVAGVIVTGFAIAACSTSTPSSQLEASQTPEVTEAATPSPASSEDGGGGPSFAPGAGDLEGILPAEVGGIALDYEFAHGQDVLGSEGMTPEAQDFLDRVGGDINGVTFATATGFDQASGEFVSIFAIRVEGVDQDRLREEFTAVMEEDSDTELTEATVGGKSVLRFASAGAEADTLMYVNGDTVFLIGAAPADLAEEALSHLP